MTEADVVVLGAGPAGLGAALALARAGARVQLLEAAARPGGLCATLVRDGHRYDIGGHIPFVRDDARLAWMRDLLGDDLVWVPRPVASVRGGRLRRGRYLDQLPRGADAPGPEGPVGPETPASAVLERMFGRPFADAEIRPYLEKIDGVPLERIPGSRPLRLMRDQAAPDGFWFPALGIGQLMDAMAAAATAAGAVLHLSTRAEEVRTADDGVRGVLATTPGGPLEVRATRLVVAMPAGVAARLVRPAPPGGAPAVAMRAVCIVYVEVDRERVTDEAWVQVDDPRVPFSRVFETANWGSRMAAPGRTVLGMECYCRAAEDDPVWGLADGALTDACVAALRDPLGWLGAGAARPLEVVRMPRAYPVPDIAQMGAVTAGARLLDGIPGVHLAPGAEVLAAVEAGERAAAAAMSD